MQLGKSDLFKVDVFDVNRVHSLGCRVRAVAKDSILIGSIAGHCAVVLLNEGVTSAYC